MSDSDESGVTYTDISSPFEELSDIGSPRADDHEYLMMLEDPYVEVVLQAPPSPDYMPGPEEPEQAPPSLDYIPGPQHTDDEIVAEDQPYAEDASPIAQSPEYVPESDFEMHPEDDDDEDPIDISSGSTTTHSDSSLYDSFIFDLSINPCPPTDRSDFHEFVDELSHIISLPEYDCFCFKIEPNLGDFTMDVVEDTFPTREPRVQNALPTHPTFQLNLDFILSSESLFAYVVWIFLFFSYSVAPQYLLSLRNEDTIFDPGICSYHIFSFFSDVSHRCGTFTKFKVLNDSPMEILSSTCSPMDQ
nr:hypothetical protein [Tanacetum cinerariifolium]